MLTFIAYYDLDNGLNNLIKHLIFEVVITYLHFIYDVTKVKQGYVKMCNKEGSSFYHIGNYVLHWWLPASVLFTSWNDAFSAWALDDASMWINYALFLSLWFAGPQVRILLWRLWKYEKLFREMKNCYKKLDPRKWFSSLEKKLPFIELVMVVEVIKVSENYYQEKSVLRKMPHLNLDTCGNNKK